MKYQKQNQQIYLPSLARKYGSIYMQNNAQSSVSKDFYLCVDGLLLKDNRLLMLKRNVEPFKGCWGLVGGHVEDDETVKDALKREFLEETGLEIEVGKLIGSRLEETSDRIKIILTYVVSHAKGEIKLNSESQQYGWFRKIPEESVFDYEKFLKIVSGRS